MMKFLRSRGLTASEQVLANLCDRSFLSLWSYPNLYRSRGKELCDLLVVFGNVVIIFSDKSCHYKRTQNSQLDWKRWYRSSIFESARQIRRTEGWIRNHPRRVFLESTCATELPIKLPDASSLRIFLVCVVSGGPIPKVVPVVQGDRSEGSVGHVDEKSGWIHVIEGRQLEDLLEELSTVGDFIDYLEKKEEVIGQGRLLFANDELDIVAYFVYHGRQFPAVQQGIRLEPGSWALLRANPAHQERIQMDRGSYSWEKIIEGLIANFISSQLEFGSDIPTVDFELMARLMARERRFPRRVLMRWILERLQRCQSGRQEIGSLMGSQTSDDVLYVLLVGTGSSREDHTEYRQLRLQRLILRCHAAKCCDPTRRYTLGMAMDASNGRGGSEDYFLLDTQDWTDEDMAAAQKLRLEANLFVNSERSRLRENEYWPSGPKHRARPRPNEACSCGSGVKFKKCCGCSNK